MFTSMRKSLAASSAIKLGTDGDRSPVLTRTPVRVTLEPVVVEGRFLVLADDPYGLYYRMTDAQAVK